MKAPFLTALCFSLALSGVNAQTTPSTPAAPAPAAAQPPKPAAGDEAKPPARETPPDQKAYMDALKITDADKQKAVNPTNEIAIKRGTSALSCR